MSKGSSAPINVALTFCDRLLRDMLDRAFRDESGIAYHGHLSATMLRNAITAAELDFVIVQIPDDGQPLNESLESYRSLLELEPRVSFLALQNHGRTASLFQLSPTLDHLGEATTDRISDLIRSWSDLGERRVVSVQ